MCGIAGIALRPGASAQQAAESTRLMSEHMRLRGPDGEGVFEDTGVVLGHRRLAILDLSARANQPMTSADRRYTVVFNGEIYNFRELRRELEAEGVAFSTTGDTEVLLALYAKCGEQMLERLRGMFAIAIWDNRSRELFLARDPYGIKPLYYSQTSAGLVFASQVKALQASGLVPRDCEPAGLAGFYLWGSVPDPWTMYREIFALPPGHWLRVRDGGLLTAPVCWHDIRLHWQRQSPPLTPEDLAGRVREALTDSVRAHLVSDVPLAVFLSGGIDSAVLAAIASGLGANIEGITLGFDEFAGLPHDEVPAAAAIASHYGLRHVERRVSRAEFEADVPRIIAAMDQPSIDGINTWFASKAAAERGFKVVLSGIGGDELFCGYSSFAQIPRAAVVGRALRASGIAALADAPCAYLGRRFLHPKAAGLLSLGGSLEGVYFLNRGLFLPRELPALMGPDLAREGLHRLGGTPSGMTPFASRDRTSAVSLLESTWYLRHQLLRDSDWASMAHSLELRTPMVDVNLLKALGPFVSNFAGGVGKALMSRSPNRGLPEGIVNRPKTGFAVPMELWLREVIRRHSDAHRTAQPSHGPWARNWARILGHGVAA